MLKELRRFGSTVTASQPFDESVVHRPVSREYFPVVFLVSCTNNGAGTCRSCRTEGPSIPEDFDTQVIASPGNLSAGKTGSEVGSPMTMRQAVEAQVLNPHCELGEHGLRQILTDVIEEVRHSVNQDIDGAEVLHSLLNAPWLQLLLKVYECLQRHLRDSPAPVLDYASGLSLQLLIDIRALQGGSEEAKELYRLLRQPHLQALLSAHDSVAQRDYEPTLPPMPEDLPDDEEATRIVCLVKNKQPLFGNRQSLGLPLPSASPPSAKSPRAGISSHWETVRRLAWRRLHRGGAFGFQSPAVKSQLHLDGGDSSWGSARRGSFPPAEVLCRPVGARPYTPPQYKPTGNCRGCCSKPVSQCRVCYANLLWEPSLNRSAPSVYSSVLIVIIAPFIFHHLYFLLFHGLTISVFSFGDNIIEELDSGNEDETGESAGAPSPLLASRRWTTSPPCLTVPYCANIDDYLPPGLPPRLRNRSPRIRTAPPSPMRPHRVMDMPQVELAKQESLDELRTSVQLAASSMENSTKDIKLLGEKMAAATERMSETVQDNSQALVLLSQVVDRLQTLLSDSKSDINFPKHVVTEQVSTPKKSPSQKPQGHRPSLTHQSRCSFPSLPSCTSSSSSLSSSLEAPSTSQGTSGLSVSCGGSPRTTVKSKNVPSPQKQHTFVDLQTSKHPLVNGQEKGGHSNKRKKKKKKKKKAT
ncbi:unnamed protein product [Pleuronectes platessa]|uniref:L27 domain-containing protein n=1 Tax=Pleuronectes platessa TaxID=8262 RepID=A0A9N7YMW2_PLEPL|nr:unnamed protein product [Pleuronectes platessa]